MQSDQHYQLVTTHVSGLLLMRNEFDRCDLPFCSLRVQRVFDKQSRLIDALAFGIHGAEGHLCQENASSPFAQPFSHPFPQD